MYRTALARSHRPRRFADLVGQDHVASTLRGAVESERVAHAYLFCGPRGIGKTTAARVLAMALNCPDREGGEPCGVCESCESIWSGRTALDVVEIDAASNRGVDDARDLRERAMYAPSDESRYKVYIVDEAHMLTREAWNALLKILEEPPPRVIFVFATTEPEKIRQTADPVLSRCQRFDFRRVSVSDLVARLGEVLEREGVKANEAALLPIARRAEGGVRDALSLLDQVLSFSGDSVEPDDVRRMLGLVAEDKYLELIDLVAAGRRSGVFPFVQQLLDDGYDLGEFVRGLAEAWRVLLALRMDPEDAVTELPEAAREAFAEAATQFSEEDLLRYLVTTVEFEASGRLRRSTQPRIQLEALLLRLAGMTSYVEFSRLIEALESGVPPARIPDRQPTPPTRKPAAPKPPESSSGSAPPPGTSPVSAEAAASPPGPTPLPQAWQETIATVRGTGLAGLGIALSGARVREGDDGSVRIGVVPGLVESVESYFRDARRSAELRNELARRMGRGVEKLDVVVEASGRPERLTAAAAKQQRLDRLMEADPNLREAVQVLDLRLKE